MKTKVLKGIAAILMVITVGNIQAQNQEEKPLRNFQLSFFPLVGTEGSQTDNYRYQFSLNLFMGITGGVKGFEAGGFLNINQGNVEGFQVSGFGNIVNGNFQGLQGAGFINVNKGKTQGINLAGFMNVMREGHEGLMGSGFMNVAHGDVSSVSGAGFMNVTHGNLKGVNGAGFMNVTSGDAEAVQGAGFMNVAGGNMKGVFAAGFANVAAKDAEAVQAAGFMNVARDLQGVQVAGFLNVARKVEGIQIGFINISDTISGVPLGFLSITRKGGLRQFEFGVNELLLASVSFKIGVPVFYNIFSLGILPFSDNMQYARGYGIGTRIDLTTTSFMHLEAHSSFVFTDGNWRSWGNNNLNEFRALYTFNVGERIQLFGGPVLYNHWYRPSGGRTASEMELATWTFHENSFREWNSQWWAGARAGINIILR
ncbi:MAG: hypothetical protein ACOCX0_05765 [Bacteroidota bacterium]